MISTPLSHYEICLPKSDVLFILHNAGETNDLIPIIQECERRNVNVRILAIGVATDLIKGKVSSNVVTLSDLGAVTPIDKFTPRDKRLTPEEVEKIANLLPVKQVISGVASAIEEQLLEAFSKRTIKTFAYWDNFSSNGPDQYFATALKVQSVASAVLFPSQAVANAPEFSNRPSAEKIVVGKPSMKPWIQDFKKIDVAKIRTEINANDPNTKIVTWIGGYGADHKKAFELFVECIKSLRPEERPKVIIQSHPNAKKEELDPFACFGVNNPMIVPEEKKMSTIQAIAAADIAISYNSTAAIQAMLLNKQVIFVVPKGDTYSNIAIDNNYVRKVSDSATFADALKEPQASINGWQQMGVPEETEESEKMSNDSVSRFMHVIQSGAA